MNRKLYCKFRVGRNENQGYNDCTFRKSGGTPGCKDLYQSLLLFPVFRQTETAGTGKNT